MKSRHLLTIPILISSLGTNAEVTLDGTLGSSGALPGPDYLIGADLGQQHGANLFHSFKDFNLQSFESATFSGSDSISNVISRVTGGNPSQIDGLIRSTILNADMYLINPYGIMFGENAQLDIQGGFHASTADYLRFGDGGRFDARNPSNSLLTVAPVEAFGFLTDTPLPITLKNSNLSVPNGKTLSLIGGELFIDSELPSEPAFDQFNSEFASTLFAEFGRINIISIASHGEIIPNQYGIAFNAKQGGKITANNTWISVSGAGSGDIFIRGGRLELNKTELEGDSFNNDGGIIDIQVDNLILQGSEISTDSDGVGQGGKIVLKIADTLSMSGTSKTGTPSLIISGSGGLMDYAGNSGAIEIEARHITLIEGARITSLTEGHGQGGSIVIKASDILSISGKPEGSFRYEQSSNTTNTEISDGNTGISGLFSNSRSTEANAGNAGTISVQAATIKLTDHAIINASAKNAGGGNIRITTSNLLYLRDSRITTSVKSGAGNGGDITINFPIFVVLDKSKFRAQANEGHGGNIRIVADHFIKSPDSLISASSRLGLDGKVEIDSPSENVIEGLLTLSTTPIDTSTSSRDHCSVYSWKEYINRSRFNIHPIAGSPPSPFDLKPSRLSNANKTVRQSSVMPEEQLF